MAFFKTFTHLVDIENPLISRGVCRRLARNEGNTNEKHLRQQKKELQDTVLNFFLSCHLQSPRIGKSTGLFYEFFTHFFFSKGKNKRRILCGRSVAATQPCTVEYTRAPRYRHPTGFSQKTP